MECTWDSALLQLNDQIPPELLQIVENAGEVQYLQAITRASLDPKYSYVLFAHCEDIFAHVCAHLRSHGTLSSSVAFLGRIAPFAPYLVPYAERLLSNEQYTFDSSNGGNDDLLYLLGLFRLFAFDTRTFKKYIRPDEITSLLESTSRPVVYLAVRFLQIYLNGADYWFEEMIKRYLGEDTPQGDIDGQWDDKVIDYRFLTLWEEQRFENVLRLVKEVRSQPLQNKTTPRRVIRPDHFDPTTAIVGGILLPRSLSAPKSSSSSGSDLVPSPTTVKNLKGIATALKGSQPILMKGLAGSGKALLIRHVARTLGKVDSMITLHLKRTERRKAAYRYPHDR